MPTEPNYFGVRLGEALSSGAGNISNALQRRYEMQRQADLASAKETKEDKLRTEELARQKAAQGQTMQMGFAGKGIAYDPMNPAASFEALRAQTIGQQGEAAKGTELSRRKDEAQAKLLESQAKMYDSMTGGAGSAPNIVKDAQGREYIVKPGPRGPEFQPVQPKVDKPLSEIAVKANLGLNSINKLIDAYSTGDYESVGGKIKASLGSGAIGNLVRSGDEKAQQLASYQQQVTQALGRMVSGAVITPSEEKEFRSLLYSPMRKKEVNIENMKILRDFFSTALPARIKQQYGGDTSMGQDGDAAIVPTGFSPDSFLEQF